MDKNIQMLVRAQLRWTVDPTTGERIDEQFNALLADAERYRAYRAVMTEPNEMKQLAMFDAINAVIDSVPDVTPTDAQADATFDAILAAAASVK